MLMEISILRFSNVSIVHLKFIHFVFVEMAFDYSTRLGPHSRRSIHPRRRRHGHGTQHTEPRPHN